MYKLLTNSEKLEFKNAIKPVFKKKTTTNKKEQPFKVYVGDHNKNIDENSLILSGICIEYLNVIVIKTLISEAKGKESEELGVYFEFCSVLIDKFIQLTIEHFVKSLLIHTNDITILEVLLNKEFTINKSKNDFYKAFKTLMK